MADNIGAFPSLQTVAKVLGGEVNGGQVLAPGPGHSAADRSLSVKLDSNAPDGFIVNSFAGDDAIACKDFVRERLGLPAFKPNGGGRRPASSEDIERLLQRAVMQPTTPAKLHIVAKYDYTDADGKLLYQVLRLEPKGFRQRRPDGNGGWIWKLDDRRVVYRWPELLKFPDATVFITEGEKDADRVASINLCATTVATGKWTDDCVKALAGRDVVILEDNDEAGRKKALEAATALRGTAKTIRIVSLPDLSDKGDVSDWLDADRHRDRKLSDVCLDTPEWQFSPVSSVIEPQLNAPVTSPAGRLPLAWLDMSNWDQEPVPERQWAIKDRVPRNQAGLFSGEGGTGKSIIELMKDVAHVAVKDWLGSLPEPGPAFYVGAEDEADELHRRLAAIADHYGLKFDDLIKGGLHVLCKLGEDATLCTVSRSGRVETTDFYRQLYEASGDIRPKNISIDTLSRAFAGNEIDRVQVYAFAMHMQALAMVAGGSVTILSHPSLQGIASGTGLSGSTAWHGAFRFRQYLKGVKPNDGEQPDGDLREFAFKKNQYGPITETIVLRYQRGLFLPERGLTSLDKLAREAKADEVFLHGLGQIIQQGRDATAAKNSPDFGPALIATLPGAKTERISKTELTDAMTRLLTSGKIHIGKVGSPPSKAKNCILPGAKS